MMFISVITLAWVRGDSAKWSQCLWSMFVINVMHIYHASHVSELGWYFSETTNKTEWDFYETRDYDAGLHSMLGHLYTCHSDRQLSSVQEIICISSWPSHFWRSHIVTDTLVKAQSWREGSVYLQPKYMSLEMFHSLAASQHWFTPDNSKPYVHLLKVVWMVKNVHYALESCLIQTVCYLPAIITLQTIQSD